MIKYYINLVKEYGGDLNAKWVYGMVIYNGKDIKKYEWEKSSFKFIDKPSKKIHPGYPLDSITIVPKFNKYLTDLSYEEKLEYSKESNEDNVKEFIINSIYELSKGGENMKKIVIASSAKLTEEIDKWKKHFEETGYNVINYPQKINQSNINEYQKTYINFFNSIDEADILFVLNEKKNDIDGYIGPETFSELSYAMISKIIHKNQKEIWLLKIPSQEVSCYTEICNFLKLGWIKLFDNN